MYNADLLPDKIRIGREYRKYSQEELAKKLGGLHWTAVQKWEKGKNQIKAQTLALIAEILELDMGFFFSDKNAEDSDLRSRKDDTVLVQVVNRLTGIENKINPQKNDNPAVLAVEHYPEIEKIVNRIRSLDDNSRMRILDKIDAYIDALDDTKKERSRSSIA